MANLPLECEEYPFKGVDNIPPNTIVIIICDEDGDKTFLKLKPELDEEIFSYPNPFGDIEIPEQLQSPKGLRIVTDDAGAERPEKASRSLRSGSSCRKCCPIIIRGQVRIVCCGTTRRCPKR